MSIARVAPTSLLPARVPVQIGWPTCSGCEIHLGFSEDYISLSEQMDSALSTVGADDAPAVYLTGHSLGGAMANIAAFELALAGYPVTTMINFGQPRVGNDAYAAGFNSYVIAGGDTGAQTDDSTAGGGGSGGATTTHNNGTNTQPTTTTGKHPTDPTTTNTHKTTTQPTTGGGGGGKTTTTAAPSNSPTTGGGGGGTTTNTGGGGGGGGATTTTKGGGGGGATTTTNNGGGGSGGGSTGTSPNSTATSTTGGTSGSGVTSSWRAAWMASMVPSDLRLNMVSLADANATRSLISPIMAQAITRMLAHPLNAHMEITPAEAASIEGKLVQHARISVAHARRQVVASPVREPFTPRELAILSRLRFPAFASAGASAGNAHLEATVAAALLRGNRRAKPVYAAPSGLTFSGAVAFRVTHYHDIVPHVPPEAFGSVACCALPAARQCRSWPHAARHVSISSSALAPTVPTACAPNGTMLTACRFEHSVEEVWYDEASDSFTRCSVKTGEDSKCSDADTDLSIEDHLHYLAQPISNLC